VGEQILQRKLQIQHRIPLSDKARGFGVEHYRVSITDGTEMMREDVLHTWRTLFLPRAVNLDTDIQHFVELSKK
jgi:hypothetical protein